MRLIARLWRWLTAPADVCQCPDCEADRRAEYVVEVSRVGSRR